MKASINYLLIGMILVVNFFGFAQEIDTKTSKVNFSVSNMKFKTVQGSMTGLKGNFVFDENNLSETVVNVSVDVQTINTENTKRDTHLKNEDFFDVVKYPRIVFKATEAKQNSSLNGYVLTGKLTMHGITKNVEIPFNYTNAFFKGSLIINRLDYGLGADTGSFMVGNEINIQINALILEK